MISMIKEQSGFQLIIKPEINWYKLTIYQNLRPDVYNRISSSRGCLNWHKVVENYDNPFFA
jgi:hypothetical protein